MHPDSLHHRQMLGKEGKSKKQKGDRKKRAAKGKGKCKEGTETTPFSAIEPFSALSSSADNPLLFNRDDSIVKLNVGGTRYYTTKSTLGKKGETVFL